MSADVKYVREALEHPEFGYNIPAVKAAALVALGNLEAQLERAREALEYYAEPMTYFGIAMIGDAPHGDFFEDFEEWPDWGESARMVKDKPGKRARTALRTMGGS